jgi:hypothetical protein
MITVIPEGSPVSVEVAAGRRGDRLPKDESFSDFLYLEYKKNMKK